MYKFCFYIALCTLLTSGCIEPIEFETGSEPPRLVVDGTITNISFNDRQTLPENPELFHIRLQWTGPINNERNDLIKSAEITLYDDAGGSWVYSWSEDQQQYVLPYADFKVEDEKSYHIQILLADGEVYESRPQCMRAAPPLQQVSPRFETKLQEVVVGNEVQFREQDGITLSAQIPEHSDEETFFYRYKVTPSWVYIAPIAPESSPVKTCYVSNDYYFEKIVTRLDRSGGYNYDLFFLETTDNQRLFTDFTAYVTQYSFTEESYNFWDELAIQRQSGGGIFDPPPFELTSNIYNVNDPDERVSGFFNVAHESSVRWFINALEIPYQIEYRPGPCEPVPGIPFIPTPDCSSCLEYRGGSSSNTTERPDWWREY